MTKHKLLLTLTLGALALGLGCESRRYDQAICVLIDVSGTYADQKAEVVKIIKRDILPAMVPGDTLIAIRIDSESYQKENVEALVTLDARPSKANAQKLALALKLDEFASRKVSSKYTDIPGAMMLGAEYLSEIAAGSRVMLIFSDLQEELPKGAKRNLSETEFDQAQRLSHERRSERVDRSHEGGLVAEGILLADTQHAHSPAIALDREQERPELVVRGLGIEPDPLPPPAAWQPVARGRLEPARTEAGERIHARLVGAPDVEAPQPVR